MTTPKELGKIFREAREALGMSMEEAYQKSHIHPNVAKDIENGIYDKMSKLYVKSFLKKYAEILDLDTEDILKKFESISSKIPEKEFSLDMDVEEEKEEKRTPLVIPAEIKEKVRLASVGILSVVLIVLLAVLIGMMKDRLTSSRKSPESTMPAVSTKKTDVPPATTPVKKPGKEIKKEPQKQPLKTKQAQTPVRLTLKLEARGQVWVQVTNEDDRTVFAKTLEEGESETLESDGTLTVWTGKGSMLDFVVNSRRVGKVASGVVKDIEVSSSGIKVGGKWVERFD